MPSFLGGIFLDLGRRRGEFTRVRLASVTAYYSHSRGRHNAVAAEAAVLTKSTTCTRLTLVVYIWSLLYLSNKVRKHKKDITQEAGTQPSRDTSRGTGFELIVPLRSGPGTGSRSTMTRSTRQPNIAPRPSQS